MTNKPTKKVLVIVGLAAVTFAQGFIGALVTAGLTDLSVSSLQAAAIGASGAALSVILNGLGDLRTWLETAAGGN